jgi:RNA recognition motif-containing protein
LFRPFGTILSANLVINKYTGLSQGFAFVSYSVPAEAQVAIREMHETRVSL